MSLCAALAACTVHTTRPEPPPPPALPALPPPPPSGLYGAAEALDDVLSGGELTYLGTGTWPGIERSRACAFRNDRVFVVNVYCGIHDGHAFRLDVHSPARGRVSIYAEAGGPITPRDRATYFTFLVESSPRPSGAQSPMGNADLAMSFEQLQRYETARHDAMGPACYGGEQHRDPVGRCLAGLSGQYDTWYAQHRPFIEAASSEWYQVVRAMRALASRYGVDPE